MPSVSHIVFVFVLLKVLDFGHLLVCISDIGRKKYDFEIRMYNVHKYLL